MRDRELYATILGVQAPWTVERVELDVAGGAVHVWLARREDAAAQCSECQTACPIYDHREREWRHLDTCQLQTRLHARVPRVECPTHGVVQTPVPWATPGSKFTLLFERLAIDWLREAAVTAVARQLKLGWDAVWGIERRAVGRGLARRGTLELRYIGLDEKSFQRRHDYVTVVSDLAGARVLFVADDRKRESLEAFWALGLTAAQRAQVEAIAMDMWEPYVQATRAQVPDADRKIVFDRFHCAKHLNEGVDRVRRAEHRELQARGDTRLTGTKYDWLRHPARFTRAAWRAFGALRSSRDEAGGSMRRSEMRSWEPLARVPASIDCLRPVAIETSTSASTRGSAAPASGAKGRSPGIRGAAARLESERVSANRVRRSPFVLKVRRRTGRRK